MAESSLNNNMSVFINPDNGRPITGKVYIGEVDLDPTVLANRRPVIILQEDGTRVAIAADVQPLTLVNGIVQYNGSAVSVIVEDGNYSVKTTSNNGAQITYTPDVITYMNADDFVAFVANSYFETIADMRAITSSANLENTTLGGYYAEGDGGGGLFYWDSTSTETDNGGTIIKATAITTGRWKRLFSGVVNVKWFGAKGDGVTDDTTAASNAVATGISVHWPADSYNITSTLTMQSGTVWRGEGYDTIFIANMASDEAIIMAATCGLENFKITSVDYPSSAITNTSDYGLTSRKIKAASNCWIINIRHEEAGSGIDCGGVKNVTITNYFAKNIRNNNGWGSVIHCSGSENINGYSIYGELSDRFIEVEDNSNGCHFVGGRAESIYPNGYVGQPGGYATYSFVLDAHSHDGLGACKNISYDGFYLKDCLLSIDVQRSTGTSLSDVCLNISFINITIDSPRTGQPVINVNNARDVIIENVLLSGTAFTDTNLATLTGSDSRNIELKDVDFGSVYQNRVINVTAPRTTINDCYFGNRTGTTPISTISFSIDADNSEVRNCKFIDIEYSTADISIDAGANFMKATGNTFESPASNTPSIAHIDSNGSDNIVSTNIFSGTSALPIRVDNFRNKVSENTMSYSTGSIAMILADTSSQRCFITGNIMASSTQTITDSGTDNTVIHNKRGNAFS